MKELTSSKSIINAVYKNNIETLTRILDRFGFNGQKAEFVDAKEEKVISLALSAASVATWRDGIGKDLEDELIHRTAPLISPKYFLELVSKIIEPGNSKDLDSETTTILQCKKSPTENDIAVVYSMDYIEIGNFIAYVLENKITSFHRRVWEAFLHAIRNSQETMPNEMLYAYMGASLKEPSFSKEDIRKDFISRILDALFID